MKNLMIFLPGKGHNASDKQYEIIKDIAKLKNAELLGINAPIPHKEGYKWFDKIVKLAEEDVMAQFNSSARYLTERVDEEIKKRNLSRDNIIFCGHSQGGFMAVHMGITAGAKEVIALCSDFPYGFNYTIPLRKDVPIYWIEARNDGYLTEERKNSYKILQSWGCDVKYYKSPESTHTHFDKDILEHI